MLPNVLQKNVVYAFGSAGNSLALTLLVPFLVGTLTRSEFGAWALAEIAIVLLSTVMILGMDVGLMREYWYAKKMEGRRRLTGTVLTAQIMWSVVLLAGCWCFIACPAAGQWLATKLEMKACGRWAGLVSAISVLEGVFALLLTVFRISERAVVFVSLSLGRVVMLVIFAITGVQVVGGVNGALAGRLLASVISVIVSGVLCRREIAVALDRALLRRVLGYGLPLLPTGLAGYVLFASDRYFLQGLRGIETVAVYTFAYKISSLVDLMVTRPFALDWAPRRFKIASQEGAEGRYVSAFVGYLFFATACGSALVVATPYVYRLFAPRGYAEGMSVVPVIVTSYVLYGLSYPLNVGIMLRNRTSVLPFIGGLAATVCIVLNIMLIPTYGMVGAAWATLGAYLVWTGAIAVVSLIHFPIRYPMVAVIAIAVGGVVSSLGRVPIAKLVNHEASLRGLLASSVWVLAVFCLIGYFLWGKSLRFDMGRGSNGQR